MADEEELFARADLPPLEISVISEVLGIHRWKTMGVNSVECECGAILYGLADPFPADKTFRDHIAEAIVEALHPKPER